MRRTLALLFAATVSVLCQGCAFTTDREDVTYTPSSTPAAIVPGASAITVQVNTVDRRSGDPAQISNKKNGYGMEMASIVSTRPVADIIRDAIGDELRRRGFRVGSSPLVVTAEIIRFRSNFETGFFSADSRAEVTVSVQVRTPSGAIAFTRTVTGESTETGVQIMSGKNAKIPLEHALTDAMTRLADDPDFVRALTRVSGAAA